ncbi:hypothetical protein D3C75_1215840 [compost metagenome]
MQVIVLEEIVDAVHVELQLGRTHLGPFDLEMQWQLVPGLDVTQALGDLQALGFAPSAMAFWPSFSRWQDSSP